MERMYFLMEHFDQFDISSRSIWANTAEGIQEIIYDILLSQYEETIDFSNFISIDVDQTGNVARTFNIMAIFIQEYGLNGYNVQEYDGIVLIEFYANDFLIGYAHNVHITTYYLGQDARHPYHVKISDEATFMDVEIPIRSGYVFNGWMLDDSIIIEGDELPNKNVDVYADWIETS